MPLTLLVVFPIGLEFATGTFGLRDAWLPARFHRPASAAFQALFAWLMTFGCMGMFRSLLVRENQLVRYTWVGTLLNGPRTRPAKPIAQTAATVTPVG